MNFHKLDTPDQALELVAEFQRRTGDVFLMRKVLLNTSAFKKVFDKLILDNKKIVPYFEQLPSSAEQKVLMKLNKCFEEVLIRLRELNTKVKGDVVEKAGILCYAFSNTMFNLIKENFDTVKEDRTITVVIDSNKQLIERCELEYNKSELTARDVAEFLIEESEKNCKDLSALIEAQKQTET